MFRLKMKIKSILLLMSVLILSVGMCLPVHADTLQSQKNMSLVIEYKIDGVSIPGASFQIYRAADRASDGSWIPADGFELFSDRITELGNHAATEELSESMAAYCREQELTPFLEAVTSDAGYITLPDGQKLPAGLYLITGDSLEIGNKMYIPKPILIMLPATDEAGNPVYDMRVSLKAEVKTKTSEVTAVKLWKDEGYEAKRPSDIQVQLCRGDQVIETVRLSRENNWQYHWTGLEEDYNWNVRELAVSENYEVSMECDTFAWYITNTYIGPEDTPQEKLPQTGMLWWPVLVLAFCGVVFFTIGWMMKNRKDF